MMDQECGAKCVVCGKWKCPYALVSCNKAAKEHICPNCEKDIERKKEQDLGA
jgi:hypothetical protein